MLSKTLKGDMLLEFTVHQKLEQNASVKLISRQTKIKFKDLDEVISAKKFIAAFSSVLVSRAKRWCQ